MSSLIGFLLSESCLEKWWELKEQLQRGKFFTCSDKHIGSDNLGTTGYLKAVIVHLSIPYFLAIRHDSGDCKTRLQVRMK